MTQKTPEQLRNDFWKSDIEHGGGIFNQYEEIKRVLCNKDIAWVKERLRNIKCHAIEQTEFYKAYKVTDEFPVVNKMTLIENHDACVVGINFAYCVAGWCFFLPS